MSWFALAVVSFVCFGAQNYLYKVSALRDLSTRAVTLAYILMSTVVLWIIAYCMPGPIVVGKEILALSALDAIFYYTTTISRIESLRYVPTSIAFPIARMSTVAVVACAAIWFREPFTWQLGISLLLVFSVLFAIHSERHEDFKQWPRYGFGVALAFLSMVTSAGTNIISKLAALTGALTIYMAVANACIIVLAAADIAVKRDVRWEDWTRSVFSVAALIAATNLLAWYAYLGALVDGPLGVVATISSLSFIVPIVLSALFHEELLTARRKLALALTAAALGLLHLAG